MSYCFLIRLLGSKPAGYFESSIIWHLAPKQRFPDAKAVLDWCLGLPETVTVVEEGQAKKQPKGRQLNVFIVLGLRLLSTLNEKTISKEQMERLVAQMEYGGF